MPRQHSVGRAGAATVWPVGITVGTVPSVEHNLVMEAMRAEQQALAGRPPPTVAEQRARYELIAGIWPVPGDVSTVAAEVAGRPAEWVAAPGARDDRTVLYFHSGRYAIGSPATHRH